MKEIVTTITQRSQVTIPAEVRRVLGVRPRDKVAFTIEGNVVHLAPVSFSLESVYGSVKPAEKPENFDKITRIVKEAKAGETARELDSACCLPLGRPIN